MTDRPDFGSVLECPKCSCSIDEASVTYVAGAILSANEVIDAQKFHENDAALLRVCGRCGYKWLEECVESE